MRTQPLSVHITQIGKNVWLGCGCKVLAGSQIQDGAVIGAGTVITRKVEQNIICYSERNYVKKIRHG